MRQVKQRKDMTWEVVVLGDKPRNQRQNASPQSKNDPRQHETDAFVIEIPRATEVGDAG